MNKKAEWELFDSLMLIIFILIALYTFSFFESDRVVNFMGNKLCEPYKFNSVDYSIIRTDIIIICFNETIKSENRLNNYTILREQK